MNKTVLITGGSGGIGAAMVKRFSELNHTVMFTYRSNEKQARALEAQHETAKAVQCDLASDESVSQAIQSIHAHCGSVDVLVNNAGIMRDKTFLKMDRLTWDAVIDTNLKSLYAFTHALLPGMVEKTWGRIINISSVAGIKGFFGKTNYSAAKAGVVGFTRSLALEVAAKGVTVNAITPGMIDTQMIADIPEKYMESILVNIPAGRLGKPDEVAGLAAFLAGDEAAYITGEIISISGGM